MNDIRELKLSDLQTKVCTRFTAPDNTVLLPLPHVIPFYRSVDANASPLVDLELGTFAEYDFIVKAVSYTGVTPGTLIQIQWPDGRYLQNPGLDFFSFVGTGKRSRLVDPHKRIRKSAKIRISIDNSAVGLVSNVELYFEGVVLLPFLKGSNGN